MISASLRFLCVSASKFRSSVVPLVLTAELPWRESDPFGVLRWRSARRRMTAASHEETASPSISVTPFGKFSRLTNSSADDTVCARSRTRSIPQADKLRRDAAGATVGRRFDVVSPVVGWLATTDALNNCKALIRTDTNQSREVGLSTHVVESNRMIESRQL